MGASTLQRSPPPSHAGLTLSLFLLLVLPALLGSLHPAALLILPALLSVLLARLMGQPGSAEVWLVRGLMVWAIARFATLQLLSAPPELLVQAFGASVMLGLAGVLFARVIAPGAVDTQRLYIATSTYLVVGFAFAAAYQVVELLHPGSFSGLPDTGPGHPQALVYFSFMTQTTVGYGDISPQVPLTRSLAMLQATGGQLYMAILVGRLVGLHQEHGAEPKP